MKEKLKQEKEYKGITEAEYSKLWEAKDKAKLQKLRKCLALHRAKKKELASCQ